MAFTRAIRSVTQIAKEAKQKQDNDCAAYYGGEKKSAMYNAQVMLKVALVNYKVKTNECNTEIQAVYQEPGKRRELAVRETIFVNDLVSIL